MDLEPTDPVLVERLGAERARSLAEELQRHGLVAVDVVALAELERRAAGHRRMEALALGFDDRDDDD